MLLYLSILTPNLIFIQNDQEDNIYIHYFDITVWF